MSQIKSNMFDVLKARTITQRKPLTKEEIREKIRNSEFFKKLKEAQMQKLNTLKKEE